MKRKQAGTIHFIPNDVDHPELGRDEKPVEPPKGSATVWLGQALAPGAYAPGSAGFHYWQAEQALNYGLVHWRELTGKPLESWQGRRKRLPVELDAGEDLNANYDREQLNFYHFDLPNRRVFTGDSPDVTCHEEGHAILDALRPDLWAAPYAETGAFHEAFGDCIALLVAFDDPAQSAAALEEGLDEDNLISNLAEDLALALAKDLGHPEMVEGSGNRVALRRALNDWHYADPLSLPYNTPARALSSEAHNFSRVFTGCFYDLIRNLYASGGGKGVPELQAAAHLAGTLLYAAAQTAPLVPRFYQAVADRLYQADAQLHAGAHAQEIRGAFERHGISPVAPHKSLLVPVAKKASVSRGAALGSLHAALGTGSVGAPELEYTAVASRMHGEMAHVAAYRPEDVSDVHPALVDVHVLAPATARVQLSGQAVRGLLGETSPLGDPTRRAVRHFARSLLETGNLEPDEAAAESFPPRPARRPGPATHAIRDVGGRRTVVRLRFA
jgi:hypothetical protein